MSLTLSPLPSLYISSISFSEVNVAPEVFIRSYVSSSYSDSTVISRFGEIAASSSVSFEDTAHLTPPVRLSASSSVSLLDLSTLSALEKIRERLLPSLSYTTLDVEYRFLGSVSVSYSDALSLTFTIPSGMISTFTDAVVINTIRYITISDGLSLALSTSMKELAKPVSTHDSLVLMVTSTIKKYPPGMVLISYTDLAVISSIEKRGHSSFSLFDNGLISTMKRKYVELKYFIIPTILLLVLAIAEAYRKKKR